MALVGSGWLWLAWVGLAWRGLPSVGLGWLCLALVGSGWLWLVLVGSGWLWLAWVGLAWLGLALIRFASGTFRLQTDVREKMVFGGPGGVAAFGVILCDRPRCARALILSRPPRPN